MIHGGDVYNHIIKEDFSISINPRPCPKKVLRAGIKGLHNADVYPEINQLQVRQAIAELENVPPQYLYCGNGASELIMGIVRMIKPSKALIVSPGFYGYEHGLSSSKSCIVRYRLKKENDFNIEEDFLSYIDETIDIVIIANPNNPTGKLIDNSLLDKIIEKCSELKCPLVIDECFIGLAEGYSRAKKVVDNEYLYVLKAFTKVLAIPGIRFGYVLAHKSNITSLMGELPEWNLSSVAASMAIQGAKVLKDNKYLRKSIKIINKERTFLTRELSKLGIVVFSSQANFLLCKGPEELYEKLLEKKILIRDCRNFEGLEAGYIRIAIKKHGANKKLLHAIYTIRDKK